MWSKLEFRDKEIVVGTPKMSSGKPTAGSDLIKPKPTQEERNVLRTEMETLREGLTQLEELVTDFTVAYPDQGAQFTTALALAKRGLLALERSGT